MTAVAADLDTTIAASDIDDGGTIDGTELAALLSATHTRINALATAVAAITTALETVGVVHKN